MTPDEPTKTCNRCNEEKPQTEFHKRKTGKGGLIPYCKSCKQAIDRAYRDSNQDKVKARSKAYRETNREMLKARGREHYRANTDKLLAACRAYYEANREQVAAYQRAYREANRDKLSVYRTAYNDDVHRQEARERTKAWARNNPEKARANGRRSTFTYEARKRGAFVEAVDHETVLIRDGGICQLCGHPVMLDDYHIDHIKPLAKGGTHEYANVQLAHPFCNISKGAKWEEQESDDMVEV